MAIIDISDLVLDNGWPLHRKRIITWLVDNVGEHYGRGDDTVVEVGAGWEIVVERIWDHDDNMIIGWAVDITDPQLSTVFALTFCGSAI